MLKTEYDNRRKKPATVRIWWGTPNNQNLKRCVRSRYQH